MVIVVRVHLIVLQSECDDFWRERDENCADVPNDWRASAVNDSPRSVEVYADNPALLFNSHLHFPTHVFVLGSRVLSDQHGERTSHVDSLAAFTLDVRLVFGVYLAAKLAVSEIEVDVFAFFPGQHEPIVVDVGAAETNKRSWMPHIFPLFTLGALTR